MSKVRLGLQAFFMILLAYLGYRHQAVGGGPLGAPPIDAYCPFGALETLPTFLLSGSYLQKTAPSNFWLMVTLIVTTVLAGAVFCGWICPLGGLSDWLYKLRCRLTNRKIEFSPAIDRLLSYGRYLMLAGIVYFSWLLNKIWFEDYDPFKLIFHMNVESATGWLIIAAFVAISVIIERAWCRYLCPLGAFTGIISLFSIFAIEREHSCIHCKKCDRKCPVGITVSTAGRLRDTRCIQCLECVNVCHVNSLAVKTGRGGILQNVKPTTFAVLSVVLFVSILGTVQVSGGWDAKSPSIKAVSQIRSASEIKGWMKWSDIISSLNINEKQLLSDLGLPDNLDRNKTVKDIRKDFGIDEEKFRRTVDRLIDK